MTKLSFSIEALPAALCCAFLAACGGGSGNATADPDAEVEDTTAPTVVSTSPSTGATGQLSDVAVSIVFSEAMDQESVEATLVTDDLGDVTLSWNAVGDTITITPDAPLAYAEGVGNDPTTVDANPFTVSLGTALDLAGNGLGSGTEITFSTLKSLSTTFDLNNDLTRTMAGGDAGGTASSLVVGDLVGTNQTVRGIVTFEIGLLPVTAVEVASATFATEQLTNSQVGAPYGDGANDTGLGNAVQIDHVSFTVADLAAFNSDASAHAQLGPFCVAAQVIIEHDVTAAVEDDRIHRNDRNDRSQYLLRFPLLTDEDGESDLIGISRVLAKLQVTYLAP